jgi:autotransporter-associated beta strand protein
VGNIENVGYSGSGSFTQSGGTQTIANYLYVGYAVGGSGTYSFSGGSLSVSNSNTNDNEYLGYSGTGTFTQSGVYYGTTVAKDGNNSPGANFAEFDGQSGGTLQVSQFISALNDQNPAGNGVLQDDTGIAAVQIVADRVITAYTPVALANAVNVTANSTIDVTGASNAAVGNVTIGGNTLSVTGGGAGPNSPHSLTAGATTLSGNPTFNVGNNGSGVGTLTLGAIDDGGTARTVTKAGDGLLILSTAATSLVQGTQVNITAGTLAANAAGALGSFGQIGLSPGAELILGADQQISSLSGSGDVALGSNTLTVGNSDNLSSTFSGTITGSSGSLVKTGAGTLILAGFGSYGGGTTVAAGTLIVASGAALPDGTSLTVGAGGAFIFDPTLAGSPVAVSAGTVAVPEPSMVALLGGSAVGLIAFAWRRRRQWSCVSRVAAF